MGLSFKSLSRFGLYQSDIPRQSIDITGQKWDLSDNS